MKQFLEERLHIVHDGILHVNEAIAIAIVIVTVLLIVLAVCDIAKKSKKKEATIFSHRKNRYKSRLGKKNKY